MKIKTNYTEKEINNFGKVDKLRLINIVEAERLKHKNGEDIDIDKICLATLLLTGHYI